MFAYKIRLLDLILVSLLALLVGGCAASPSGDAPDRLQIDPQTGEIKQESSEKNADQSKTETDEQVIQCSDGSMRLGVADDSHEAEDICQH